MMQKLYVSQKQVNISLRGVLLFTPSQLALLAMKYYVARPKTTTEIRSASAYLCRSSCTLCSRLPHLHVSLPSITSYLPSLFADFYSLLFDCFLRFLYLHPTVKTTFLRYVFEFTQYVARVGNILAILLFLFGTLGCGFLMVVTFIILRLFLHRQWNRK